MKIRSLILAFVSLFLTSTMFAQTSNSLNKQEVMESVINLSDYTQNWIDQNFTRLTTRQVNSFISQSNLRGLEQTYAGKLDELKSRANAAELEEFYNQPTDANLRALFSKYNVSIN